MIVTQGRRTGLGPKEGVTSGIRLAAGPTVGLALRGDDGNRLAFRFSTDVAAEAPGKDNGSAYAALRNALSVPPLTRALRAPERAV